MDHKVQCPYCPRRLVDRNGAWMHVKVKHPRKSRKMFAPIVDDDDESFADRAIRAEHDQAAGVENFDSRWLLT